MNRRSFALFCITVATSLIMTGCGRSGPEIGEVFGKVTLDGIPVKGATVYSYPDGGGRSSISKTNDDGFYELYYKGNEKGAKVGSHSVTLTTATEDTRDESGKVIKGISEKFSKEYSSDGTEKREVKAGRNDRTSSRHQNQQERLSSEL